MNVISYIRAKHNLVLKLILVTICSVIITCLLPKREVKGHTVGAFDPIWPHADLVVDKDFYLKKSDAELRQEYRQIENEAPLFFEINNTDKITALRKLEGLKETDAKIYSALKPLFDSIYSRGVIETLSESEVKKPIMVYTNNYAEQAVYDNFFTVSSALAFIEGGLRAAGISDLGDVNYLDYLAITHFSDKAKTKWYVNSKTEQVSIYHSAIRAGDVLVKRGEALTNDKRYNINRYFFIQNQNATLGVLNFLSRWLLTFVTLLILLFYLVFFRKQIFGQNKQVFFLFMIVLTGVFTTYLFHRYGLFILTLPFTLIPILVRVFFDSRTALFTHLIAVLLCSFFMPDKLEFILLQLISGIGTLFTVAEMRKRQQILNAAVVVLIIYVLLFFAYETGFGTPEYARKISAYVPFGVSAMLVLLAYPLIYLIEKVFGFISDFKLLELCDLNQPLLRQLSQEVPGTFQHSLQVANLAEEAIYYIGGNTLLVRTGAMYHDVGKLINPKFFTENQVNGYSPHIEMLPLQSAKTIINHVIKGIELAKEHGLPEQIIDFIRTHHGTTYVGYFLNLYKKEKVLSNVDENEFRYPGPIPFSKETAVLMMADGVEAASRSLPEKDAMAINDLVDQIIDYKISQNQFINSDITFKDITLIKKIFKKRLMNIYHVRIEYPS
ncbi:MAG: HDIG domain-containing protein [Bacteroidetes bacterium]|nr:HDIG domain-containing protein [Bacteroidota bacterium]